MNIRSTFKTLLPSRYRVDIYPKCCFCRRDFSHQWKASNWSVINCTLALVFYKYCATFCHPCRYLSSVHTLLKMLFELAIYRLVAFLNQNTSGPAAFQLDILAIARFSSFTVMITFSYLGVSHLPSSATRNLYCASLVQSITCSNTHLIPLDLVTQSAHSSSIKFLVKLPLIISEHVVLVVL